MSKHATSATLLHTLSDVVLTSGRPSPQPMATTSPAHAIAVRIAPSAAMVTGSPPGSAYTGYTHVRRSMRRLVLLSFAVVVAACGSDMRTTCDSGNCSDDQVMCSGASSTFPSFDKTCAHHQI